MSHRALVANAADPEQVEKAGERVKFSREQEVNDVAFVLSTKQGRRFIWRYLSLAGMFQTSFHPSGSVVYFNEGRRDLGLKLLADVEQADTQAYMRMSMEAKSDEEKRNG